MNKVMGGLIIFLALVIAIVPAFTDCLSQGRALTTQDGKTVPMKCHWTGIAEMGVAIPLGLIGILSFRKQRKDTARSLAAVGAACGALAVLFPTVLIGTCANPDDDLQPDHETHTDCIRHFDHSSQHRALRECA